MDRKEFLKDCGRMGFAGWMLSLFPWLESCSEATRREVQGEKARIGIIGTGSRGLFHIQHLLQMPQVEVTALCDDYTPHLEDAAQYFPAAKLYSDYRQLLEDRNVDGVIIATPLYLHAPMTLDAMEAGKRVFCEKAMAYSQEDCLRVYNRRKELGAVLFIGQQRLFDPMYIKLEIPTRFDQLPVQYRNLEYIIDCVAEAVGVTVTMPMAFAKAEGC